MIPQTLYKFRDWGNKEHRRVLTENEIYFSSSIKFNDPFDTAVHLSFRYGTDEEIKSFIKRVEGKRLPAPTDKEIEIKANKMIQSGVFKDPKIFDKFEDSLQEEKYSKFGIFTMSASFNNNLLWSHYANSHKGFCVGINSRKLDDNLKNSTERNQLIIGIYPVIYQKNYPELNGYQIESDEDAIVGQLAIKPIDWFYEEEYRAICLNATNFVMLLKNGEIDTVVLGCRITDDHKNEIIEVLSKKKERIDLIQAKQIRASFELGFEKIEF